MIKPAKLAFLGIGLMGRPMAINCAKDGHVVNAWNRSVEKAADLGAHGITVASDVSECVSDADIVISMVSDGPIVHSLIDSASGHLKEGALWIDMSSTRPDDARQSSQTLSTLGCAFLDAPVSGGTKGAEGASLAIMVGGDTSDFDRAVPVFQSMGRPVHVGPTGAGQLAKLANQTVVAITIGAVAEAMLLLEKGGADPAAVRNALKGGFADSTIMQQHGQRMTERDFVPGGLSRLQVKDLDNVLEVAANCSLHLPMTEQIAKRFERYVDEMQSGERDHSGLYEELLDLNGLL